MDIQTPLPSIRNLSQALAVNPNTLQKAYTLLENEGLCYSVPGSGRYVSRDAKAIISKDQSRQLERIAEEVVKLAYKGMPLEEILRIVRKSFLKTAEKNDG